jgi:hypothetical protein
VELELNEYNLTRLIAELYGRRGVDDAIDECWEWIEPQWKDLWDRAVEAGHERNEMARNLDIDY